MTNIKEVLDTKVTLRVLMKLPPGNTILGIEDVTNMRHQKKRALMVMWVDRGGLRKAHFCVDSGEYLGECL